MPPRVVEKTPVHHAGVVEYQIVRQELEPHVAAPADRIGLAPSRAAARQLVCHGHIRINGAKVDIPSYLVRMGQEISLKEKTREQPMVKKAVENRERSGRVGWIEFSAETLTGKLLAIPSREDIPTEMNEQLIVELYSK